MIMKATPVLALCQVKCCRWAENIPAQSAFRRHIRPSSISIVPRLADVSASPKWRASESLHLLRSFKKTIRSEEHTSELQSLMRISYAVFCLKKKKTIRYTTLNAKQHNKQQ